MYKLSRKTAIVVSVILILAVSFSRIFVIAEINHDCLGESCPICHVIQAVENNLKDFLSSSDYNAVIGLVFTVVAVLSCVTAYVAYSSLVELKVKIKPPAQPVVLDFIIF